MKRNSLLVFLTFFQLIFFNYLNAEDSEEILEEIVIVGKPIKTSQMESIQAKKISDNIVEVISSDDIGRFPDQNIADALGRVPGVSIERDQGRSRFLNFLHVLLILLVRQQYPSLFMHARNFQHR